MERTCPPCAVRAPRSIGRCILNAALLVSFVVTVMVPLTGIALHKLASVLFLALCIVHTVIYRRELTGKRLGLLVVVAAAFFSGLFGMILEELPAVLTLHRVVSIGSVFFLAIHIFVFHRRFKRS